MTPPETIGTLLDFAAEPLFFVDGDGVILDANNRAKRALGGADTGDALPDRIQGGRETFRRIVARSARTSSALPCGLTLDAAGGGTAFKAECRRFGRPGEPLRFGFRLRVREAGRFAALKRRIDDLNRENRERRLLQRRLEQSLESNERLLRELQHRVKNNIQLLTALLAQQAARAGNDEFSALVETARQRLLSIGRAHEFMYRTGYFANVPAADFIGALVDLLREGFVGDVRIDMDLQSDWQVPHERANTLALIVNELVVNAYKHGVRDGVRRIGVCLAREADAHVLTVRDHGPGFPDDADVSGSLGLVLVRGLCNDLDAGVEMFNDGGAVTRIRVPCVDQP